MSWMHCFILSNVFIEKIINYIKMKYCNNFKNMNIWKNVLANKGALWALTEEAYPFSVTLEAACYNLYVSICFYNLPVRLLRNIECNVCNWKAISYQIMETVCASKPKVISLKVLKHILNRNLHFWVGKPVQKHTKIPLEVLALGYSSPHLPWEWGCELEVWSTCLLLI